MAFGARVEVLLDSGERIVDELALANAHPLGAKPFQRADYIGKFRMLTQDIIAPAESERFLRVAQTLEQIPGGELHQLNVALPEGTLARSRPGIF